MLLATRRRSVRAFCSVLGRGNVQAHQHHAQSPEHDAGHHSDNAVRKDASRDDREKPSCGSRCRVGAAKHGATTTLVNITGQAIPVKPLHKAAEHVSKIAKGEHDREVG